MDKARARENLKWAFAEHNIPLQGQRIILDRWKQQGRPSLLDFAPYTSFTILVVRTHMFASGLKLTGSKQKSSDVIDMEYLMYIPFCRFLVSNDNFQLRFFDLLRETEQSAVKGSDMKSALSEIVDFFGGSPLSRPLNLTRDILRSPPKHLDNIATDIWDVCRTNWR